MGGVAGRTEGNLCEVILGRYVHRERLMMGGAGGKYWKGGKRRITSFPVF